MRRPHDGDSLPGSHGGLSIFELQTAYGWSTSHLGGSSATEELLGQLDLSPHSVVLDLGCGPGETAFKLAERYRCRVFGLDRSHFNISIATKRAGEYGLRDRVFFCTADADQLPFAAATFSHILVQSVLAFLPDASAAAGEMHRVLRADGQIAINEGISEPRTGREHTSRRLNAAGYRYHDFRSMERWKSLLVDSGFTIRYVHRHAGKARRPITGILWWVRYTASRMGKFLLHHAIAPQQWRNGLLFFDLFRLYAFRQPAFLLLVAEPCGDGVALHHNDTRTIFEMGMTNTGYEGRLAITSVAPLDAALNK